LTEPTLPSQHSARELPAHTREAINSALLSGARSKRIEIVEKALELGADPNAADHFGMTAMHLAASANDVRMIKVLMKKGARTNDHGGVGFSPMACAAVSGRMDAVQMLAEHALDLEAMQSNPQYGGRSLLEVCLISEKTECARWLIDHGADIELVDWRGDSLIMRMLASGRDQAAMLLARSGACVDDAVIDLALQQKNTALVHELRASHKPGRSVPRSLTQVVAQQEWPEEEALQAPDGAPRGQAWARSWLLRALHAGSGWGRWARSMLSATRFTREWTEKAQRQEATRDFFQALSQNHPGRALSMLRESGHFIDINARDAHGLSALHLVVRMASRTCGKTSSQEWTGALGLSEEERAIAHLVLAIEGMGPDRSHLLCRIPENGNSALHELMEQGHARIALFLLERQQSQAFKFMVNLSNHALHRPLHLAVQQSDPRMMSELVQAGAHLNAFDRRGNTPLHMASFMLEQSCAEMAINLGASISLKTREGLTMDEILLQRKGQSDMLQSMLAARKMIESAKSIFSSNNPLSQAVKARSESARKTKPKSDSGLKLVMPKRRPPPAAKPQDPS
jgi:ankyrin repeat protein